MKRGEVTISNFIVGLVVFSAIAGILVLFMSSLNEEYGLALNDNESFAVYNKLSELSDNTDEVLERLENQETKSSLDKLGELVEAGSYAVSTAASSVNVMTSMLNTATSKMNLGGAGRIIYTLIIVVSLILIGFVTIRIITGRDG